MAALDSVEFGEVELEEAVARAVSRTRSPLHAGAAAWVQHACLSYLKASAELERELKGIELRPERSPRVVQGTSPVEHRILTTWGRWYVSADGTVREFRRVRISRHSEAEAPSTLAAAFVVAAGRRAAGKVYRDLPIELFPEDSPAERIRVVEVLLGSDASPGVLIDAPPDEIERAYRERARPVAIDLVAGGSQLPGRDCGECKLRPGCGGLPRAPGLLGVSGRGTHPRTWSVTTGRLYELCPAQAHFQDLRLLGRRDGDNPAIRRGVAVHEWLRVAHGRPSAKACSLDDLPDPDSGDIGLADDLMTVAEYRSVRPFLLGHLQVCPLDDPALVTGVRPEPMMAVRDPDADVVVVAEPDLIRRVDGQVVYREQKTASRPLEVSGAEALRRFPQLALAVCLVAAGVFESTTVAEDTTIGGLVELEVMTPVSAAVLTFDASDPEVLATAREIVAGYAREWHRDTEFRATPGDWCAVCPAARWCPDKASTGGRTLVVDGMVIDVETGEVLEVRGTPSNRAAALAAEVSEPDAGHDDAFSY
ncbi:PD-(D/E)XK nuclease family protein [Actinoallomurus sp. NPDC052274]|uniref:PD-(D/E)XK nuclease family protein n=1 Tax=Actinoallomurus sp. NPDC052274 TaxID=3155420 RepID=UPI0034320BB4